MQKKRLLSLVLAIGMIISLLPAMTLGASAEAPAAALPIYKDPSYSFAERAADIVANLSLKEKASQMVSGRYAAIPRLGLKAYGWWNEALHGIARIQYNPTGNATVIYNTTSYPINYAIAASWNPDLVYEQSVAVGDETREVVPDNMRNLSMWSPTINLARDPRWGRNDEAWSEDPYLTTMMAGQFVNGLEGKDMNGKMLPGSKGYIKVITTLKHFAANNSEVNRRTGSANMDTRTLREYYTKSFRDIVEKYDVQSIMTSYNRLNETPTSASNLLMDTLLRQTWGFDGFVTSDCDSVMDISQSHKWAPDILGRPITQVERMAFAIAAGEDLNCFAGYSDAYNYAVTLPATVDQKITTYNGLFTENQMDISLARLFEARYRTGEFDFELGLDVPWITEARERVTPGTYDYTSANSNPVTMTDARMDLARRTAEESIVLLKNADVAGSKVLPLKVPATGAFKVAVIGYFANPNTTTGAQAAMFLGGYSSSQNAAGQAKHVRPFDGISAAVKAVNPDAEVTFYRGFLADTSKTPVTQPATAADLKIIDPAAVTAAADADLCIVYVGTDSGTANEAGDRATIVLPGAQAALIAQVGAANPKTVAVLETIGPMEVASFEGNVPAILFSSYNGQRKGEALANVLMGKVNPSGKTTSIWYKATSQIPDIKDYTLRKTETLPGRTYMYFDGELSYPFGYGLSYTNFTISNGQLSKATADANETIQLSVVVKNSGAVKGAQVVQLYAATPDAPAALERPIKRLIGFKKVMLDAGESKTVTFDIKIADLAFFNEATGKFAVDTGRYNLQVATSSANSDVAESLVLNVTGALTPKLFNVSVKAKQASDEASDIPERLIFDKNATVVPQVTVSMSDETLYGYILKGQSVALPAGMTVSYTSNRPSVVSVAGGVIKTGANYGVATVTATVSYNGETMTDDFIVVVKAGVKASDITVNGASLKGFDPNVTSYNIAIPYGVNTVPDIHAICSDPGVAIVVDEADAIPGIATVTLSEGGVTNVYTIGFGRPAVTANFKDGSSSLGDKWTVLEGNDSAAFTEDGLKIATERGDFLNTQYVAKNVYLQPGSGSYVAETKINFSASPAANNQQAGILIKQDDANFIRFVYERPTTGSNNTFRVYHVVNGTQTQAYTVNSNGRTAAYLRVAKSGLNYTFSYSIDGNTWTTFGTRETAFLLPSIGVFAYNGNTTAASINATFEYFSVDPYVEDIEFVQNLVTGYAAHVNVEVKGEGVDGLTVKLFDVEKAVSGGVAKFDFTAKEVPAVTENTKYDVAVFNGDKLLKAEKINVVTIPADAFKPSFVKDGEESAVIFTVEAAWKAGAARSVTINGTEFPADFITNLRLHVNAPFEAVASGAKIVVKGIKYPNLFPSYSFTFTITNAPAV